jgi:hypothetical protein
MTKQELVSFINANYELAYSITDYSQEQLQDLLSILEDEDLYEIITAVSNYNFVA